MQQRAITSYTVIRTGMRRGTREATPARAEALLAAILWGAVIFGGGVMVLTVAGW